jgi:cytochrome c biogenesis protein CcmG, thiol:disulfide interchange protein DsbE
MTRALRIALYALPLVTLTALVAWFALALSPDRDPSIVPSALIDKPAPTLDLPSVYPGRPGLSSADLKGRVTVVNVFASWCLPCRAEHPVLSRLAREQAVTLVAINWKDAPEAGRAWLAELGDPFERVGSDPSGRAGIDWGVYGVPETYIVDPAGRIRYKHVGPLREEDIASVIAPVLRRVAR